MIHIFIKTVPGLDTALDVLPNVNESSNLNWLNKKKTRFKIFRITFPKDESTARAPPDLKAYFRPQ